MDRFLLVLTGIACAIIGAAPVVAAPADIIKPQWYSSTTGKGIETMQWQQDKRFTEAIAYMASSIIYDANTFSCADPADTTTCYDALTRCPRPRGASDVPAQFLQNFTPYHYCSTANDDASMAEMVGTLPNTVKNSVVMKNMLTPSAGPGVVDTRAYLFDSYAVIPKQMRRTTLGVIKQLWAGIATCADFKARTNIELVRPVSAPAYYYDCAYRNPSLNWQASGAGVNFVARDRGNQSGLCTTQSTIFFDGANCTGKAYVFIPASVEEANFFRTRPSVAAKLDSNLLVPGTQSTYNGTGSQALRTALLTEILDRTVYYSFYDEAYRRTVRFEADGSITPYLPTGEVSATIKSFYEASKKSEDKKGLTAPGSADPSLRRCYAAVTSGGGKNVPTDPLKEGQYGFLDRLPAPVSDYSGYFVRQYRDVKATDTATLPESQRLAFVRNEISDYQVLTGTTATASLAAPNGQENFLYPLARNGRHCPTTSSATPPPCPQDDPLDSVSGQVRLQHVALREWWSDDGFGDPSGLSPALTCGESEFMLSLGRNNKNYSAAPQTSPDLTDTAPYCLRYLLSKEPRFSEGGELQTGDAGNPLADLSMLSRGILGGSMVCETDPVLLAKASEYKVYKYKSTTPFYASEYDYASKFDDAKHLLFPLFLARTTAGTVYTPPGATEGSSTILDADGRMSPKFDVGVLSLPFRAMGLGNPDFELPVNYGRCARLKIEPEHPDYPMGPLALPMRDYITQVMELNLDATAAKTPPNCP